MGVRGGQSSRLEPYQLRAMAGAPYTMADHLEVWAMTHPAPTDAGKPKGSALPVGLPPAVAAAFKKRMGG